MRSRLGRRLAAVAAGNLARRLTEGQARELLKIVRPKRPLVGGDQIQMPAQAAQASRAAQTGKQQPQAKEEDPVAKLREAAHKLTPEQAEKIPPELAAAVLEILGHSATQS